MPTMCVFGRRRAPFFATRRPLAPPTLRAPHPASPDRPNPARSARPPILLAMLACTALACGSLRGSASGQAPPPAAAAPPATATSSAAAASPAPGRAAAAGERLKLSTSDDCPLAAWHYPAARAADADKDAAPPPVAILLHDLGGSHQSLEPLALELQARGITVVAPDLRGHGASAGPPERGDLDSKTIKKADFDAMVVTGGGRVRTQAAKRGDVETVRNWIMERAEAGAVDKERLVIVGCGVGAAVAAQWAVADAAWPDLATGPQGRSVRGLVLVSPAWTTRGFSISPAMAMEPVRRTLPILVVGGSQDADAVKIYEQFKRQRPDAWNEKRIGDTEAKLAPKLEEAEKRGVEPRPTLWLRQLDTRLSGDRLAAYVPKDRAATGLPADLVDRFLEMVTAQEP